VRASISRVQTVPTDFEPAQGNAPDTALICGGSMMTILTKNAGWQPALQQRAATLRYGLRWAPRIATEMTHFSEERLCQAWRVPF
jgi:hypothetical protein